MNRVIRALITGFVVALALTGVGASMAADLTPEAKDVQVLNARRENRILTAFNLDPRLHAYDLTVIVDGSSGIEHVDIRIRVDSAAAPRKRDSNEPKGG